MLGIGTRTTDFRERGVGLYHTSPYALLDNCPCALFYPIISETKLWLLIPISGGRLASIYYGKGVGNG